MLSTCGNVFCCFGASCIFFLNYIFVTMLNHKNKKQHQNQITNFHKYITRTKQNFLDNYALLSACGCS